LKKHWIELFQKSFRGEWKDLQKFYLEWFWSEWIKLIKKGWKKDIKDIPLPLARAPIFPLDWELVFNEKVARVIEVVKSDIEEDSIKEAEAMENKPPEIELIENKIPEKADNNRDFEEKDLWGEVQEEKKVARFYRPIIKRWRNWNRKFFKLNWKKKEMRGGKDNKVKEIKNTMNRSKFLSINNLLEKVFFSSSFPFLPKTKKFLFSWRW